MQKQLFTRRYVISLTEDSCEISMLPKSKSEMAKSLVFASILFIVFTAVTVVCAFAGGFGYSIMFGIASVLIILATASGVVTGLKRQKTFRFLLDASGVTHTDVDKTYFMPWDRVASFGTVSDNEISGQRNATYGPKQICLYFSVAVHDEKYLRKKFNRIGNRRYGHCSSDDMIVMAFEENDISEAIEEKIYPYVFRYCEKAQEYTYKI